jgi:hypothetical protein
MTSVTDYEIMMHPATRWCLERGKQYFPIIRFDNGNLQAKVTYDMEECDDKFVLHTLIKFTSSWRNKQIECKDLNPPVRLCKFTFKSRADFHNSSPNPFSRIIFENLEQCKVKAILQSIIDSKDLIEKISNKSPCVLCDIIANDTYVVQLRDVVQFFPEDIIIS